MSLEQPEKRISLNEDQGLLIDRLRGNGAAAREENNRRRQTLTGIFTEGFSIVQKHGHVAEEDPRGDNRVFKELATDPIPTHSPNHDLQLKAEGSFIDGKPETVVFSIHALTRDGDEVTDDELISVIGFLKPNGEVHVGDGEQRPFHPKVLDKADVANLKGVVDAVDVYFNPEPQKSK